MTSLNLVSKSLHKTNRPTIGFLIDWLGGPYQSELWFGMLDAAQKHDVNLLCFVGGSIDSPHGYLSQSNALYNLESLKHLDGIVLASGTIADYLTPTEFKQFCESYAPVPMASIALQLAGIPSVLVDNHSGMYQAVQHLIEVHKHQQIAYIGGPKDHTESQERFAAYKKALHDAHIPFNPELVYAGDLVELTGNHGIKTFIDERKIHFDAVVCVDDSCAFGVLAELEIRGIRVPHDIAVVGFDNVVDAQHTTPALTTVSQPLREQSYQALEFVLKQMRNEPIPEVTRLPTELVTRQSCGCRLQSLAVAEIYDAVSDSPSTEDRKDIFLKMLQASPQLLQTIQQKDVEYVFDCFLEDLMQGQDNEFLKQLDILLQNIVIAGGQVNDWQNIISVFRRVILPTLSEQSDVIRAENLLHQARLIVSDMIERVQSRRRLELMQNSLVIHEVGQDLLTTIHLEDLLDIIVNNIHHAGIPACYIAIYGEDKQQVRLLLAYDGKERLEHKLATPFFETSSLLPDDIIQQDTRYTFVIEELYFREEHLGYVVFKIGPRDGMVYTTMRRQLSSALKGALLLQERKEVQLKLRLANDELKTLYKAKDEFVSNVSHEFRTPLANLRLYLQLLERNPYKSQQYIEVLQRETTRLNMLIESLLTISRMDQSRIDIHKESFNLAQLAQEYVDDRQLLARQNELTLQFINSDRSLPPVRADLSLIGQVISIFMSNAINYTPRLGSISVSVQLRVNGDDGQQWVGLSMKDTGMGIRKEDCERVFERFYRGNLQSSLTVAGTGLGLSIAKEIIELHQGKIGVESEGIPGKGSTFSFWLSV